MKILHVVGSFPVETHTFVLWQLHGAIARGHQVKVLATNPGNDAGYAMARRLGLADDLAIYANYRDYAPWGLDLRRLNSAVVRAADRARYGRVLAERRKSFFCNLATRSELQDVDVVQVHFVNWAIEIGLGLAQVLRKPCVVTAHGAVMETSDGFLRQVDHDADAVVVVSGGERDVWLARSNSDAKLHTVWNGLPLPPPPIRTDAGHDRGSLDLVTIGRLAPEKRIGDIVEAIARLNRTTPCTLTIFGEGPLRDAIAAQITQLGLNERIQLAGNVSHDQVMARLGNADVLIHAADSEPFGLAMIEAMACGLPVVATRSSGAQEIVDHGVTGFLSPCADVDALVSSTLKLAEDPALRRRMGDAGRERAERLFSLEAHMIAMEKVWTEAIEVHRSKGSAINTNHATCARDVP